MAHGEHDCDDRVDLNSVGASRYSIAYQAISVQGAEESLDTGSQRPGRGRRAAAAALAGVIAAVVLCALAYSGRDGDKSLGEKSALSSPGKPPAPVQSLSIPTSVAAQLTSWGYTGETRPEKWADIDLKWKKCSNGKLQSPINIVRGDVKAKIDQPKLRWEGLEAKGTKKTCAAKEFWDMGQVVMGFDDGPVMKRFGFSRYLDALPLTALSETSFTLIEMRVHAPSEHKIDGQSYDAEIQLSHECNSKTTPSCPETKRMVVSILLNKAREELGEESPKFLGSFLYDENFQSKWSTGWVNEPVFDLGGLNDALYGYMVSAPFPFCFSFGNINVFRVPRFSFYFLLLR